MRSSRSALLTLLSVGLLTAVAASPVAADTEPAPTPVNSYLSGTSFTFTAGGVDYFGIGQIEEERITHQKSVSFFFSGDGAEAVCDEGTPDDPSDDWVGTTGIEFFATSWKIQDYGVKRDLGKAELNVKLKGQRVTTDPCTGEVVTTRIETHVFCFVLRATAPGEPETDVQIVTTDAGTFEVTSTYEYRPAAGPARLDGRSVETSDGSIQHSTVSVTQL